MVDHNEELHKTEPEFYNVIQTKYLKTLPFGDRDLKVGFCVNSPGGWGYCDEEMLWISDDVSDPREAIQVSLHESLHAIFPHLTEVEVGKYAGQMTDLIVGVFKSKGDGPLPKLKSIVSEKVRQKIMADSPDFFRIT